MAEETTTPDEIPLFVVDTQNDGDGFLPTRNLDYESNEGIGCGNDLPRLTIVTK